MIVLVDPQQHPERRDRFLDAVCGRPYFGDLLPAELAVFGMMHGAPVPRFFTATPAAALCVRGRGAQLCGTYDVEETGGFLQLHGVEHVQTDGAPPAGYVREQRLFCMAYFGAAAPILPVPPVSPEMPASSKMPVSSERTVPPEVPVSSEMPVSPERTLPSEPLGAIASQEMFISPERVVWPEPSEPPITGLTLDKTPPPGETADFLMRAKGVTDANGAEIRDNFYSELCTKLARGAACVWAVRRAGAGAAGGYGNNAADSHRSDDRAGRENGPIIASAGVYALTPKTAYLAAIETAGPLRGRGIGSWLVGALTAHFAGEGRRVALVCRENRVSFYERLGFRIENTIWRCAREAEAENG